MVLQRISAWAGEAYKLFKEPPLADLDQTQSHVLIISHAGGVSRQEKSTKFITAPSLLIMRNSSALSLISQFHEFSLLWSLHFLLLLPSPCLGKELQTCRQTHPNQMPIVNHERFVPPLVEGQ